MRAADPLLTGAAVAGLSAAGAGCPLADRPRPTGNAGASRDLGPAPLSRGWEAGAVLGSAKGASPGLSRRASLDGAKSPPLPLLGALAGTAGAAGTPSCVGPLTDLRRGFVNGGCDDAATGSAAGSGDALSGHGVEWAGLWGSRKTTGAVAGLQASAGSLEWRGGVRALSSPRPPAGSGAAASIDVGMEQERRLDAEAVPVAGRCEDELLPPPSDLLSFLEPDRHK